MDYREILHVQLPIDEGVRKKPYVDTKGKITIGVGRNLTDVGISDTEVEMFLENDITAAEMAARDLLGNFDALSDVRKAVVVEMAFQLGYAGLAEFTHTLQAIRDARFGDAADGMRDSEVAKVEAPARWERLELSMRSDIWTR